MMNLHVVETPESARWNLVKPKTCELAETKTILRQNVDDRDSSTASQKRAL